MLYATVYGSIRTISVFLSSSLLICRIFVFIGTDSCWLLHGTGERIKENRHDGCASHDNIICEYFGVHI